MIPYKTIKIELGWVLKYKNPTPFYTTMECIDRLPVLARTQTGVNAVMPQADLFRLTLPKLPRLTPQEAKKMLLKAGFEMLRSKGIHRIYAKDNRRIVIPFHSGKYYTQR